LRQTRALLENNYFYKKYVQQFLRGSKDILTKKNILGVGVYTLLIWVFTVMIFFIFFKQSLDSIEFSLFDAVCLTLCTTLSLAVSTLPSSIGLFEAGVVYYLNEIKGVDQNTALALALVFHLLILLPQLVCMSYFLISKHGAKPEGVYEHK
jgi:uncharacterized protein (TIRG00374 family)